MSFLISGDKKTEADILGALTSSHALSEERRLPCCKLPFGEVHMTGN